MEAIDAVDVPKNGALVQLRPNADQKSSGDKKCQKFGLKKLRPRPLRKSSLSVISERTFGSEDEADTDSDDEVFSTYQKVDVSRRRSSLTSDLRPVGENKKKIGVIKRIGLKAVSSPFQEGDIVLIQADPTSCLRFDDLTMVMDVNNDLIKIPECLPTKCVTLLHENAWTRYSVLKEAANVLSSIQSKEARAILVCNGGKDDPLAPLTVQLSERVIAESGNGATLTINCIEDELILWMMRNMKRNKKIQKVQWNPDTYEEVLVERTKDACKGLADVAICLESNPKVIQRTMKCLSEDGTVIVAENPEVEQHLDNFVSAGKIKDSQIRVAKKDNAELKDLLDLLASEKKNQFCLCCLGCDLCTIHKSIKQ